MTSPDAAPADYVVVIDRTVLPRVEEGVDIIAASIDAQDECVVFRTDEVTVQARIDGIGEGWAQELQTST